MRSFPIYRRIQTFAEPQKLSPGPGVNNTMTMPSTSATSRALLAAAALALSASFAFAQAPAPPPSDDGPDPALVNLAPSDQTTPDQTQQLATPANPQDYLQQTPAPIVRQAPSAVPPTTPDAYNAPATDNQPADTQADSQVAAGEAALDDADTSADQPPPPLPDYDQPPAPADNYIWTPGYWAYAPVGYYWVPGAWVYPPFYGALWTPPYWGWFNGRYRWHPGYWGTHVGFYGGVNYGFGYIGIGYFGGYWAGNTFFYNRAVTTVGPGVGNVYVHTVVYNNHQYGPRPTNNISYNGGRGGINVAPRPAELAAMHETHTAPLAAQLRLHQTAAQNPQAAFNANGGRPTVTVRPTPVGANRTIAPSQSEFQGRSLGSVQPARSTLSEPRVQSQPRPQQQSRPAPQYHPAPASHPAPPAAHESKH
jgi:hypothetical protein